MSKALPINKFTSKIGSGATPRGGKEAYLGGDYALIRSQNVHDFIFSNDGLAYIDDVQAKKLDNVEVKKGDVLLNITGDSIARCCSVPNDILPARVNQHVSIIRCKNIEDSEYLKYYLINLKSYLMQICGVGGTRNALTKEAVEKLIVKFQDNHVKLAKVLSSLDSKIELNNKINKELEAMAKTLYDYWFVQFNFPDENGKPYKSSGGKMVYNQELKREIPEGWEIGCIGDYCKSTGGFAFKSSWWTEEGVSVIKIKDIQENYTIDMSNLSKVDLSNKNIDDKFKAEAGNILIAMTGATVGKYAIVPITDNSIYINQRVGYFNLGKEPTKKLPYFINSLNQSYFREMIFTLASGAAQPNISNEQINNIKLLVPKNDILKSFNNKFSSFYKLILNNQQQNQELAKLRDWLLPMLMNGQVKVK